MENKKVKLVNEVIQKLQQVEDPELFIDIVNLGLIYGIEIENDHCTVAMTLTTMGCPLNDYLNQRIKKVILEIPAIKTVTVKLVWYPVWTTERMSLAAKKALGVKTSPSQPQLTNNQPKLDLTTPIKTFADRYPNFVKDMVDLGFTRIKIPGMLNTVGRVMNLKLGAQAMNFKLDDLKNKLVEKGYYFDD